jgi:hypothetical protein
VRWVVLGPTDNVNGWRFDAYAPLVAAYVDERFTPTAAFGYWALLARRPDNTPTEAAR